MTLHPAPRAGAGRSRRRLRTVGRSLLLLLLACVLALIVLLPFAPWVLRPSMVQHIVPWLLSPSTGFFSLTAVFWLLFIVPGALRALAGARRRGTEEEPGPEDEGSASEGVGRDPEVSVSALPALGDSGDSGDSGDLGGHEEIRIPAGTFRELDAGHRQEMALALGIPWRDELVHDHQDWAVACLEAALARAASARR